MKLIRDLIVRRGLETAAQLGADAAATATSKTFVQRFTVHPPVTVMVRGSQVDVRVHYREGQYVELNASLRASFGWEFIAEQDEAGVYIVAKRKPIVGAISTASFTLIVPPEANIVLHLTPGSARLHNLDGKLMLPAPAASTTTPTIPPAAVRGTTLPSNKPRKA